ncbi:UNVERIFIED_CONTAM: protein NUCLEAR FUSION defective, mitochondrial [Sesamum calycinum]|uniref:Protein NUCLEAR FUSION defective, mitochondrial n=1 Tax=Sesamum calycinum TaxID=2727403 RepID=A0AAW2PAW9_9LAMI
MNLRHFFRRSTVTKISKLHGRGLSSYSSGYRFGVATSSCTPPLFHPPGAYHASSFSNGPKNPIFHKPFCRYTHTVQQVNLNDSSSNVDLESENDATMNEFLSRFVWIMRKKLSEAYPDCDKKTIDGMLAIIVEKVVSEMEKGGLEQMTGSAASTPSEDFSEDLWRAVWEVSNVVLQDMEKEKKKEKMKIFLQSEEVKEMYRFAGEVGIRGDMLRELRFKWARQKMEESEFYESLEQLHKEDAQTESPGKEHLRKEIAGGEEGVEMMIMWVKVADKVHKSSEVMWPQEPKPISGRCKLVTDKILSLQEADDPAPLLREWIGLLQPSRVDWIAFLDRLKEQNSHIYFKIAELVLGEESFHANVRDYSKLIDSLAKENRLEDAERILTKMNENGILPDVITLTIVVHMYCKSGNLDRAKEAFESSRAHGFQPDMKVYNSMIRAYVNAGQPKLGESLMREMETRDIKPTKEIYMALLRSFAQVGDVNGADRISTTMQFAGFQPSQESCALMVEACERAGNLDQARHNFDQMMKLGHKPDDRCTASMIAAYEKKNLLDKALNLLLELEKDGIEPGLLLILFLLIGSASWSFLMKLNRY